MARLKHAAPASRSGLVKLLVLLLAVACFFTVAAAASSSPPSTPPKKQQGHRPDAAGDLICHTDVAAECYPRVFQATDVFQTVHEDQDLPPGLHVRLNVYTGEREAKLNSDTEAPPAALAGLAVDRSVVLVDRPDGDAAEAGEPVVAIPRGAPAYDPVGTIKEPVDGSASSSTEDALTFFDALALVKGVPLGPGMDVAAAEQARFADALEQLDEYAHDIYYGLKLVEDPDATRQLFCLMGGGGGGGSAAAAAAAQKAAAIVGAAVQNNPKALRAIEQQWAADYEGSPCGASPAGGTLGGVIFGPLHTGGAPSSPAWARSRLLAINGLIKSDAIMKDFLARGGLTEVLRLLVEQEGNPAYDAVRTRAAYLVSDNFLDAGMGADVSLWPAATASAGGAGGGTTDTAACGADGRVHAHCWSHHIQRLAAAHKQDTAHWAHDLWKRLQQIERGAGNPGHDEL